MAEEEEDLPDPEENVQDESDEIEFEHSQEDEAVDYEDPGGAPSDAPGAPGAGLAEVLRAGLSRGLEDLGLAEGVAVAWAESLAEGLVWPEGLAWPEGLDAGGRRAMRGGGRGLGERAVQVALACRHHR
ncbi:unnamed protein product [Prorocentrum cordatum]|nr:unnamed protein product [Polarella glacialis]